MQNIKIISIFAGFGFLLSFLFGLFSHSQFLSILIKALIFAIVFGIIGFLVSVIYSKLLSDGSGDSDSIPDSGAGISGSSNSSKGQNVDIVIQDQEIERSDSPNSFDVGSNFHMLNSSDIATGTKSNAPESQSSAAPSSDEVEHNTIGEQFIPMTNFEKVDKATVQSSNANQSSSAPDVMNPDAILTSTETGVVTDELDTLPDLENLDVQRDESASGSENESDGSYDDSISTTSSISSKKSSSDSNIEIKDASLMAKAISSILSNEES